MSDIIKASHQDAISNVLHVVQLAKEADRLQRVAMLERDPVKSLVAHADWNGKLIQLGECLDEIDESVAILKGIM